MSLLTMRNKVCRVIGETPSDAQALIDDWINTEAERLYRENDFPDCLAESTLRVSQSSFIALPSYIGQLRAVRENRWLQKWQITSMFPRYVQMPTWNIEKGWKAWRIVGRSPLMVNLSANSPIILSMDGLDVGTTPTVTIKGATASSHSTSELITMDAVTKQSINAFVPNPVSITKSGPNAYNILGSDTLGNILFVLNNDEVESRYIIVNIQGYPFAPCNQLGITRQYRCVDVLYKKTFRKMIADGDTFMCGTEYEDLIVDQVVGFWSEQSDRLDKSIYYYQKVQAQLKTIFEDKTGGEEHRMHFAPSGYLGWFDRSGDLCCGTDGECCDEGQILEATTVIPPQPKSTLYYNTEQTFVVGCPLDTTGASSSATIAAGIYSSYVSQGAADILASLAAKAAAQAALVCVDSPVAYNTEQSYTATCPAGTTGVSITATSPAGTFSSREGQGIADAEALLQATQNALNSLVCNIVPVGGCPIELYLSGQTDLDATYPMVALGADTDISFDFNAEDATVIIYANGVEVYNQDISGNLTGTITLPTGTDTVRITITNNQASDQYNYISALVPSVTSATPTSFGVQIAGDYRVRYKTGSLLYGQQSYGHGWKVSDYPGVAGHGYRVLHDNGGTDIEFPVNTYTDYNTQEDAIAGNLGSFVNFTHTGGTISMFLQDTPYGDNVAGNPAPTFELYKRASGNWRVSLYCDNVIPCGIGTGKIGKVWSSLQEHYRTGNGWTLNGTDGVYLTCPAVGGVTPQYPADNFYDAETDNNKRLAILGIAQAMTNSWLQYYSSTTDLDGLSVPAPLTETSLGVEALLANSASFDTLAHAVASLEILRSYICQMTDIIVYDVENGYYHTSNMQGGGDSTNCADAKANGLTAFNAYIPVPVGEYPKLSCQTYYDGTNFFQSYVTSDYGSFTKDLTNYGANVEDAKVFLAMRVTDDLGAISPVIGYLGVAPAVAYDNFLRQLETVASGAVYTSALYGVTTGTTVPFTEQACPVGTLMMGWKVTQFVILVPKSPITADGDWTHYP